MPESMSVSGRAEFEKWYAEQVEKNVEFDFQKELVEWGASRSRGCLNRKPSSTHGITSRLLRPVIEICGRTGWHPTPLPQNPSMDGE